MINPNEPDALLTGLHVEAGQKLAVDDLICTLETTKSTADLHAETAGFVVGLRFGEGDTVRAGEILAYLAESPDWSPGPQAELLETNPDEAALPEGLRITNPALAAAREQGVNLAELPTGVLVTESMVRSFVRGTEFPRAAAEGGDFDPTAILIYGCGGHGKSVLDLLRSLNVYRVVGFIDDGVPAGEQVLGVEVLGGREVLKDYADQGIRLAVNAVGGIGDLGTRRQVFQNLLESGFHFPAVVHPKAVVEPSADLASGAQVFPLAYIGSDVRLGFGVIVNTGAIVSHECLLEDLVNISPGAVLAGAVKVGEGALIGMGATINLGISIGARARVGNGATVKTAVPENGIVPAGTIWPIR
jgi:sugar O-acyltransferase (sialic acid O-acetyltransferase NeuD family)